MSSFEQAKDGLRHRKGAAEKWVPDPEWAERSGFAEWLRRRRREEAGEAEAAPAGEAQAEGGTSEIVVHGTDGTVMTYHAVHGPEFSPSETGWVLTIKGPRALAPQTLTVGEVLGDLQAMMPDERSWVGAMISFSREMVKSLAAQAQANEGGGGDAAEMRERSEAIERELAAGLSEIGKQPPADADRGSGTAHR